MTGHITSKTAGAGLALAALGWAVFLAGLTRVVSHPLQPLSLALLAGDLALSVAAVRLGEKAYRDGGGSPARLSYMLATALFGAALLPFWTGLAFAHMQ